MTISSGLLSQIYLAPSEFPTRPPGQPPRSYTEQASVKHPKPSIQSTSIDSGLVKIGSWGWGFCQAVVLNDSRAFIGNGRIIQALNISDPDSITIIAEFETPGPITSLALRDSILFATYDYTLLVLDVSNPGTMVELSRNLLSASINKSIHLEYPNLLVLTWGSIIILDIQNPSQPIYLGGTAAWEDVQNFIVHDGYLYLCYAGFRTGFDVIDATDVSQPSYIAFGINQGFIPGLAIKDSILFAPAEGGGMYKLRLTSYDISDPYSISELHSDTLATEVESYGIFPSGVTIKDSILYIVTRDSGIFSVLVHDISSPTIVGRVWRSETYDVPIETDLFMNANNILAVTTGTGVWYVDCSNPELLATTDFFYTGEFTRASQLMDSTLIMSQSRAGICLIDVRSPSSPVILSSLELPRRYPLGKVRESKEIIRQGRFIYDVRTYGIEIADVNDPSYPAWVGFIPFEGPDDLQLGGSFFIDSTFGYILQVDSTLVIYDVSDISSIVKLGSLKLNYRLSDIFVHQNIAYLGYTFSSPCVIIDVSDKMYPVYVRTLQISARNFNVKDSILFAENSTGINILSITTPDSPIVIQELDLGGSGGGALAVIGEFLFVVTPYGLRTFDITNGSMPSELGDMVRDDFVVDICGDSNNLYLSNGGNGVSFYRIDYVTDVPGVEDVPSEFRLDQNYPNPFNSSTSISYQLNQSGHVILRIYDIVGRVVLVVVDEPQSPGDKTISMDTSRLASGPYIYELRSNDRRFQKKMMLVK